MPLLPKRSGVEARLSRALRCGTTDDASSGTQTRSRTCVVIRASLLSQVAQRLSLRNHYRQATSSPLLQQDGGGPINRGGCDLSLLGDFC